MHQGVQRRGRDSLGEDATSRKQVRMNLRVPPATTTTADDASRPSQGLAPTSHLHDHVSHSPPPQYLMFNSHSTFIVRHTIYNSISCSESNTEMYGDNGARTMLTSRTSASNMFPYGTLAFARHTIAIDQDMVRGLKDYNGNGNQDVKNVDRYNGSL